MSSPTFAIKQQGPPGPSVTYPEPSSSPWPPVFRDAFAVRKTVFCDEQHCSLENELDEDDHRSWHWVIYTPGPDIGEEKPVGTLRLVPPPHPPHPTPTEGIAMPSPTSAKEEEPYIKLTRLAVLPEYRGYRLGRRLVSSALDWASAHVEECSKSLRKDSRWQGQVLVHAQVAVERVWGKMGFVTDGSLGQWDEEGIMHLGMRRRVDVR